MDSTFAVGNAVKDSIQMEMNSLTQAKAMMEDTRKRMSSNGVDPTFARYRPQIMEEAFVYNGEPDY